MLYAALLFFIISIIAGLLGFTGIAVASAQIAQAIFFICIVLFCITLILFIIAASRRKP